LLATLEHNAGIIATLRSIIGEIFGEIPGSILGKFLSIFDSGLPFNVEITSTISLGSFAPRPQD